MTDCAMAATQNYARIDRDAYYTPAWCVEALIRNVPLCRRVWEPASGGHAIVGVLADHGFTVRHSDIHGDPSVDFLTVKHAADFGAIVTNPPYSLADQFIAHALMLTQNGHGQVCMLLRNEFDCAATRTARFFAGPPYHKKIVLTRRPRWIPGSTGAPRHNYAWYVWDWSRSEPAVIVYAQ